MSALHVRVFLKFTDASVGVVLALLSSLCFYQVCYDLHVFLTMSSNGTNPCVIFGRSPLFLILWKFLVLWLIVFACTASTLFRSSRFNYFWYLWPVASVHCHALFKRSVFFLGPGPFILFDLCNPLEISLLWDLGGNFIITDIWIAVTLFYIHDFFLLLFDLGIIWSHLRHCFNASSFFGSFFNGSCFLWFILSYRDNIDRFYPWVFLVDLWEEIEELPLDRYFCLMICITDDRVDQLEIQIWSHGLVEITVPGCLL